MRATNQINMKTIKELEAEQKVAYSMIREAYYTALKDVLGLIDELEVFGIEDGNAILKEELKERING